MHRTPAPPSICNAHPGPVRGACLIRQGRIAGNPRPRVERTASSTLATALPLTAYVGHKEVLWLRQRYQDSVGIGIKDGRAHVILALQ